MSRKVRPGGFLYLSVPFATAEEQADPVLCREEWEQYALTPEQVNAAFEKFKPAHLGQLSLDEILLFILIAERKGNATCSCTSGSANAVYIRFRNIG